LKAYLISGLGADKKAFQKLKLPEGFEPVFLDWIPPHKNETLQSYSGRLSGIINSHEEFVLIGLSFGGMVASEIARLKKPVKTIIISSLASADELPWYFKKAGKMGLHKTIPVKLLKTATFLNRVVGAGTKEDKAVIYHYIRHADPGFIRWSLNAIIRWDQRQRLPGVIHVHGDKDHLLPLRFTHPDFVIKNGGHLMVLNKANEVNNVINQVLKRI
jgi:pimeloyl-ACP methyl ester carboxylesterase